MKSVTERIGDLRMWWLREYHNYGPLDKFRPNIVYLGQEEYWQLLADNMNYVAGFRVYPDKFEIYGMQIKRVTDQHHISVGRVFEDLGEAEG